MPRCEGRPDGPSPDGRNNNTVRGTQGDLMLCRSCDEFRFPSLPRTTASCETRSKSAKSSTAKGPSTSVQGANG